MSHELAQEALDALKETGGNKTAAAISLGMNRSRLRRLLIKAASYGLDGPTPEPLPPGMRVKKTSTLYDAQTGEAKLVWVKACEDQASPDDIADILKEAFSDCEGGAKLIPPPAGTHVGKIAFLPVADLHMGLHVWGDEAAANWNLKKSDAVIREAFQAVISSSPPCETCIILGGGVWS